MKKRSRLSFALVSLALGVAGLILALAACSKSEEASGPKQLRMAGIVFQEDQFFRLILFGMRDAAAKHNIELLEANSNNQPDKEFQLVNTYTSQHVDAILISPLSAKGSVAALQQAHDKGIKVVTNNTTIDADFPEASVVCSPEDLGVQTGKAARKYIEEHLGGKAKVAILAFKAQEPEQSNARVGGFKKALEGMADVQIVSEQDAWLSDMAMNKAGDILTANLTSTFFTRRMKAAPRAPCLRLRMRAKRGRSPSSAPMSPTSSSRSCNPTTTSCRRSRPRSHSKSGSNPWNSRSRRSRGSHSTRSSVLNGICLTRADLAGVQAYAKQFKEWTSK